MGITFDFFALHYLNLWLANERAFCKNAESKKRSQQLSALQDAAAHFSIARNLLTKFDLGKGLKRYEPVLEILDNYSSRDFQKNAGIATIIEVHDKLSKVYGKRKVLSATTKFLWVKFRSPIIIYDGQARKALGTTNGDIEAYYQAWEKEYAKHKEEIEVACHSLVNVHSYIHDSAGFSKTDVESIAKESWFKRRVLDSYLWHGTE